MTADEVAGQATAVAPAGVADGGWHRVHPLTPAVHSWQVLVVLLVVALQDVGQNLVRQAGAGPDSPGRGRRRSGPRCGGRPAALRGARAGPGHRRHHRPARALVAPDPLPRDCRGPRTAPRGPRAPPAPRPPRPPAGGGRRPAPGRPDLRAGPSQARRGRRCGIEHRALVPDRHPGATVAQLSAGGGGRPHLRHPARARGPRASGRGGAGAAPGRVDGPRPRAARGHRRDRRSRDGRARGGGGRRGRGLPADRDRRRHGRLAAVRGRVRLHGARIARRAAAARTACSSTARRPCLRAACRRSAWCSHCCGAGRAGGGWS